MKIIFTSMPMKKDLYAMKYPVPGNVDLEYDGEVIFPINAVLAKDLKEGEKVSVVMLMNKSGNKQALENFDANWNYDPNNKEAQKELVRQLDEIRKLKTKQKVAQLELTSL